MPDWFYHVFIEGEAVESPFYDTLLELRVDENVSGAGTFAVRFSLSKLDNGGWSCLDDERFDLFNRLTVRAGFGTLAGECLIDGFITRKRAHFIEDESGSYLEISGMDHTVLMNLEEKSVVWQDMKDSDIATKIFSDYQISPVVDDTGFLYKKNEGNVIQKGTDIQFLKGLARRNGYECHIDTDASGNTRGYFRKPVLDEKSQKSLALHFRDNSNLVSLDSRIDSLRPLSVTAEQSDTTTKKRIKGSATTPQSPVLGGIPLNELINQKLSHLVRPRESVCRIQVTRPVAPPLLQNYVQTILDEGAWFVSVKGEINSDAYQSVLRSKHPVLIKGAGLALSGTYYVTKVSHVFTPGKYVQLFEARRNALDLTGNEVFVEESELVPEEGAVLI
ncbi:MAG: hypothetical protein LUQ07_07990 [Methanospirillum sp.]|nr:hypothetical protein [Methanospirillum sp.]